MQSLLSNNESTGLLEEDPTKKMVQQLQQSAPHQQTLPIGPECSGCFNLINERYYLAVNDRVWHLSCLRCIDCKLCLDTQQSCFSKDGFIYCKDDYFKRFPRKCNGCNQNINSNELIMKARNLLFHIQCFKCLLCDKLLNPGDEFGIDCRDDYSILCKTHYFLSLQQQQQQHQHPSLPPSNEFEQITPYNSNIKVELSFDESNKQIIPTSIYTQQQLPSQQQMPQVYTDSFNQSNIFNNTNNNLANDKSSPSFNNSSNNSNGTNSKGRPKKRKLGANTNEQPVTKKQAKSKQMLLNTENNKSNNNTNSSNNNNNVKTTSSAVFNKQVSMTINSEALTNNNLLVNQHQINNQLIQAPLGEPQSEFNKNFEANLDYCGEDDDNNNQTNDNENDDDEDAEDDDDDLLLDISHGNSSASLSHQSDLLMGANVAGSGSASGYYGSVAAVAAAAQRQKRMRTSFKHHQLRVMKSYFELNHNPDAKDLKQLSQKTGLSKRVLQVWFQNARAKFRRGQGGPCDQMNNGTNSSQQLSPNVMQSFASSNELANMNANNMLFQKQHLDMIDEASSQSLSEHPNKAILSSSSSISSSSSLSLNINSKSESSYSFARHNDGYPFQDQQQSLHI